jgi:branched-chain amino acid transport system ATP-binding protein
MHPPTAGDILVTTPQGREAAITGLPAHKITKSGLARTFQNIRLFQNMTVLENVMIGRHPRLHAGILGAVLRDPRTREEEQRVVDDSYRILQKIGLEDLVDEFAKNLAYAAQRRLEIARALATEPFMLLLDEPAAGMNPRETRDLDELILRLRDEEELTVFLIEHDMSLVMRLSERIYVMDYGKLIAEGSPDEIKNNHEVITAYLGEDIDA